MSNQESPLSKTERTEMGELPKHARYDGRVSMSLYWFTDEAKADRYGELVEKAGYTYNGGFFDGSPCGREKTRDYTDKEGVRQYAVSC